MRADERLLTVILAPIVSEKSTELADKRRIVAFRVVPDANKHEVKRAVEKLFEVKVKKVGIINVSGKRVRSRTGVRGQRRGWKKAYVALEEGFDINLAELQ